jgi:hypothetical protein
VSVWTVCRSIRTQEVQQVSEECCKWWRAREGSRRPSYSRVIKEEGRLGDCQVVHFEASRQAKTGGIVGGWNRL